jgi:ketosteroid isomerase-like protein
MFNVFEQPYTLLGAAVLVLLAVLTFRSVFPEKRRWWQMLIPVVIAGAAFGLDALVQTDLEKINAVIDKGVKAIQNEDYNAIARILSADYSDSYHDTKEQLLAHCRRVLPRAMVRKHNKTGVMIKITGPEATAVVFTTLIFDKNSYVSQSYKPFLWTKSRLTLRKQPDGRWLISRIEVLEIDRQPVNWSRIR